METLTLENALKTNDKMTVDAVIRSEPKLLCVWKDTYKKHVEGRVISSTFKDLLEKYNPKSDLYICIECQGHDCPRYNPLDRKYYRELKSLVPSFDIQGFK